jgi:protein-tyrosine kinase
MDHIRVAIDKARKERQTAQKQGADSLVLIDQQLDVDGNIAALEQTWQALPTFDVDPEHLVRNRIMTYQATPHATHFDATRTNLLHKMRSNSWRRVAITSPGAKCGKTTLSLNLAFSLARQSDLRVMVIELDLRRPSIARLLRLRDDMNFALVLAGRASAADHIQRHGRNLAIAASQHSAESPAELLQGLTAAHAIDAIEDLYQPDVIIFDMPPMLVVDDMMAFIDQIDATLLVGAAESSTLEEISRCKQDLEARTNLIGVVLNKCRYLDTAEGYNYGAY